MSRVVINPATVYSTLRHGFSQAVVPAKGTRVLLSGQVGVDIKGNTVGPGLAEQTRMALDNIEEILSTLDGTLDDVALLRIHLVQSHREDPQVVAEALLERFPSDPPACTWFTVSGLTGPEWRIEIEAEAVLPDHSFIRPRHGSGAG